MSISSEIIAKNFKIFLQEKGEKAFSELNSFFAEQRNIFYEDELKKFSEKGIPLSESSIKIRQGWVSAVGSCLEQVVKIFIEPFCEEHELHITNDKILSRKKLSKELDLVKRALLVNFGKYAVLPDGDIILYKMENNKQPRILAILSIKKSFRERYTETPYWKLKLLQSEVTRSIKVFMITPDADNEISFAENARKSRIVMEYELDCIYMAKEDFDATPKMKSINQLITDLKALL